MKTKKERDLSGAIRAFMENVKGCNGSELVAILEEMIAEVQAHSYFVGVPEEEGAAAN